MTASAQAEGPCSVDDVIEALQADRTARTVILDVLGIPSSNRDPLADAYEHLGVQVFAFGGSLEGQALTRAIVAAARTADSYEKLACGVRAFGEVSDAELRKRVHYISEGNRELSDHSLRHVFVHRNDGEQVRPPKTGRLFNEP